MEACRYPLYGTASDAAQRNWRADGRHLLVADIFTAWKLYTDLADQPQVTSKQNGWTTDTPTVD